MRSHYELLGVARDADPAVIKVAYLRLSRTLHPDMPSGNSALFGMITEVYEILRDPQKRANYDQIINEKIWTGYPCKCEGVRYLYRDRNPSPKVQTCTTCKGWTESGMAWLRKEGWIA